MVKSRLVALTVGMGFASIAMPALAQPAPGSIADVMAICTPVIAEQYAGDDSRYGFCIGAVQSFVTEIGAPSPEAGPALADLVVALVELYQFDDECLVYETELPVAIDVAAGVATDPEQVELIRAISQSIAACDDIQTAAIELPDFPTDAIDQASPF